jgi:DNA-binding NarL/FixJ family response regulator
LEVELHLINKNQDKHHSSTPDCLPDSKARNGNFTGNTEASLRTIRILVADDYALVRRGLRTLLELQPGWKVEAEAGNGQDAVDQALKLRPDVVILDVRMPVMNGLDAARLILKALPATRILMMISLHTQELIEKALHAGVRAFLLKSDTETDLVAAVKALIEGRTFYSSVVPDRILEHVQRPPEEPTRPDLTPREREILQLLAEGKSNKEVARALGISTRTAENHRAHIMEKLGFRSFSELVRYAIRSSIIEP